MGTEHEAPKGEAETPRTTVPASDSYGPAPGAGTPAEVGGRQGPDPTRYGDWEKLGRCIDF